MPQEILEVVVAEPHGKPYPTIFNVFNTMPDPPQLHFDN